jgi:hypothetical protein
MSKVTYLLGAGASCQCLPTYQNFGARYKTFLKILKDNLEETNFGYKQGLEQIIALANDFYNEFNFHNTPDTIAKKYFHQTNEGQAHLDDLKIILTLFFIYEQGLSNYLTLSIEGLKTDNKQVVDKRYDAFIASILNPIYGELTLNSNINILTYNYDVQFEICYQNYSKKSFIDCQLDLQSIPGIRTIESSFKFDISKFSIVHLNGIAYSERIVTEQSIPAYPAFTQDILKLIEHLVEHFRTMKTNECLAGKNFLHFAWERSETYPHKTISLKNTLLAAEAICDDVETLVIIGYSFPIFNRPLDTQLIKRMKNLRRIYIQAPNADEIKDTLRSIFSMHNGAFVEQRITTIKEVNYFHIPNELESGNKLSKPGGYDFSSV